MEHPFLSCSIEIFGMVGFRCSGLRANRVNRWTQPKPTLHVWSVACAYAGGAKTNYSAQFQQDWTEEEARKHIN